MLSSWQLECWRVGQWSNGGCFECVGRGSVRAQVHEAALKRTQFRQSMAARTSTGLNGCLVASTTTLTGRTDRNSALS